MATSLLVGRSCLFCTHSPTSRPKTFRYSLLCRTVGMHPHGQTTMSLGDQRQLSRMSTLQLARAPKRRWLTWSSVSKEPICRCVCLPSDSGVPSKRTERGCFVVGPVEPCPWCVNGLSRKLPFCTWWQIKYIQVATAASGSTVIVLCCAATCKGLTPCFLLLFGFLSEAAVESAVGSAAELCF